MTHKLWNVGRMLLEATESRLYYSANRNVSITRCTTTCHRFVFCRYALGHNDKLRDIAQVCRPRSKMERAACGAYRWDTILLCVISIRYIFSVSSVNVSACRSLVRVAACTNQGCGGLRLWMLMDSSHVFNHFSCFRFSYYFRYLTSLESQMFLNTVI